MITFIIVTLISTPITIHQFIIWRRKERLQHAREQRLTSITHPHLTKEN